MATLGSSVTYNINLVAELPWIWEHQCGFLNRGRWTADAVCLGCRYEVSNEAETHLHLLVDAEPDKDA